MWHKSGQIHNSTLRVRRPTCSIRASITLFDTEKSSIPPNNHPHAAASKLSKLTIAKERMVSLAINNHSLGFGELPVSMLFLSNDEIHSHPSVPTRALCLSVAKARARLVLPSAI